MKYDTHEIIALGAALMIACFIGIAIYVANEDSNQHEADRLLCESKGGIQLERTYSQGRTAGHSYTCILREVVL